MAGILESLFDGGGWQNLLGIGEANAAAPMPQPPPQVMQQAPQSFSPNSTFDAGTIAPTGGDRPPSQWESGKLREVPTDPGSFAPGTFGMSGPDAGGPLAYAGEGGGGPPPAGGRSVPVPGAPGGGPGGLPTVNGGGSPAGPPGAPMPPPMGEGPPTMSSGGGLAGQLGITPQVAQSALAGVGRGMSAVGGMRAGAPKGAAFATGLGGGIQGQQAKEAEQVALQRQAKNDLFAQSSTAFKDMLAADAAGDNSAYKAAQAKYLTARSQAAMTGGAAGSKAWQNTPYGKVIQVESKTQQYEKAQQIVLQKQWTLNGATAEQQKDDLGRLQKQVDEYRDRLYKAIGVKPDEADKIKNTGTAKDNAFDTKGMSLEEFNTQVPLGAWYKDQNGVPRQRIKPPAGMAVPDEAAARDDQTAMAG